MKKKLPTLSCTKYMPTFATLTKIMINNRPGQIRNNNQHVNNDSQYTRHTATKCIAIKLQYRLQ